MKLTLKPCPCGCRKFIASPLFFGVSSSLDKEDAEKLVDRWNAFEEAPRVRKHALSHLFYEEEQVREAPATISNVDAWRLGEACRKAAEEPKCGDYIDRGLILLRELQAKGYGIVKLADDEK